MVDRFMKWLRPSGLPLWVCKRPSDGDWLISFNEGNFPNFTLRPGFIYVAVWLGRPFRFYWMSFLRRRYLMQSKRIVELQTQVENLRAASELFGNWLDKSSSFADYDPTDSGWSG